MFWNKVSSVQKWITLHESSVCKWEFCKQAVSYSLITSNSKVTWQTMTMVVFPPLVFSINGLNRRNYDLMWVILGSEYTVESLDTLAIHVHHWLIRYYSIHNSYTMHWFTACGTTLHTTNSLNRCMIEGCILMMQSKSVKLNSLTHSLSVCFMSPSWPRWLHSPTSTDERTSTE